MSNEYRQVELLTGNARRRRWTTEQKLTIIEQSFVYQCSQFQLTLSGR